MWEIPKLKINLSALEKTDAPNDQTTHSESQNWDSGVSIDIDNSPINDTEKPKEIEKINIEQEEKKNNFIQLESINKYVEDKKEIQDQKQKDNVKQQESTENNEKSIEDAKKESDSEVHFSNYTSYFDKQSKNVFKRIQKFRYAPQTRSGLLVMLILFTWVAIASLMIFFPEKHSFTLYKASILEIYEEWWITKWRWNPNNIENLDEENGTNNLLDTIPTSEDSTIIEPENSQSQDNKVDTITKDKLKQHLLDKYRNQ